MLKTGTGIGHFMNIKSFSATKMSKLNTSSNITNSVLKDFLLAYAIDLSHFE
jgi:hypothetical protein